VHGEIVISRDECLFYFFREQPLAADLGEEAVLHPVAGRADGYNLDRSRCGEIGVGRRPSGRGR
jgi:hypothetical protein